MIDSPERRIRPARPGDAGALNELTKRSVMHWGYDPAFLEWEPEAITVDVEFLQRARATFLLEEADELLGYYALVELSEGLSLDKLFVEPKHIGTGCGRVLWNHAVDEARRLGASSFTLFSDPNAAPIYAAFGARFIREIETDWPNWSLHEFHYEL